jgi:hypothetical protein
MHPSGVYDDFEDYFLGSEDNLHGEPDDDKPRDDDLFERLKSAVMYGESDFKPGEVDSDEHIALRHLMEGDTDQ